MCYNAEISLNTYIFGTIIAIILLFLNKINILLIYFVYTITLMQLLEYLAWININNNDIDINKQNNIYYLSIIGCFILFIQVLILNTINLEGIERIIIIIIIFIISIYGFYYNYKNNQFNISVGKNGHLIWHWIDIKYLNIIVLFFWLYSLLRIDNYLLFILTLSSILFSIYNYYKYKTFGSMWCFIANFLWIVLLFNAILLIFK